MTSSIPFLRKSNISEFVPMMSNDEVIKQLLTPTSSSKTLTPNQFSSKLFSESNLNEVKKLIPLNTLNQTHQITLNNIVSSVLVTTFHSLSINVTFTKDILEYIANEVRSELTSNRVALGNISDNEIKRLQLIILDQIGEYVKVVHDDYNIKLDKSGRDKCLLSDTNFAIKKKQNIIKRGEYFYHESQFGLLGYKTTIKNNKSTVDLDPLIKKYFVGRNSIFNTSEIVDYKLKQTRNQSDANVGNFLNKVDKDKKLITGDGDSCSLSFIMMNNPKMRVGTKNSLELSTFLNSLSTIELSKCLPYLDVKFILPSSIETKSTNVFQTSSITQFLDGTPISTSDNLTSSTYKTLSANFVREIPDKKPQRAVETNFSAFTMPQTVNNFDETYVGHFSSYAKGVKGNTERATFFKRNNTVHDYTKPFLTIKSFNIDVAPTQGLMSFKTGRLSLVLHDKSRMSEIAPFIKPDLFGSFGAEIAIEYGWSHMDAIKDAKENQKVNYFAQFLDENRVYEKFIITNSSYNIDKNGQVNIDLAIAMKGPVSIRAINFESDAPAKIDDDFIKGLADRIKTKETDINLEAVGGSLSILSNIIITPRVDKIVAEFGAASSKKDGKGIKAKEFEATKKINDAYQAHNKKIKGESGIKKLAAIGKFFESIKNYQITIQFTDVEAGVTLPLSKATEANFNIASGENINNYVRKIDSIYKEFTRLSINAVGKIRSARAARTEEVEGLLQKITDGLSIEDPFFDLENYYNLEQLKNTTLSTDKVNITKPKYNNSSRNIKESVLTFPTKIKGIDSYEGAGGAELTDYVSLGNIILAVIGSHLAFTRSYDEIQIVSYTANSNAGLAMNKNVASLLIDKKELTDYLFDIFRNGAQYTLESLLTQIVKKFISTRYCVNYGLRDFYKLNENKQVTVKDEKKKPEQLTKEIDERLELIYNLMYKGAETELFVQDIKFVMPKIKLLFDTVTTKKSGGVDTILRISLFDRNDNPFNSISSIMNKVYEKGVQDAVRDINKRLIELKSLKKKDKNYSKHKKNFIDENKNVIKKLIDAGFLQLVNNEYVIKTNIENSFTTIKDQLKAFMPSVNYGSNNSGIIDASISTINEAKLNTVYMTRPGRNEDTVKTRVKYLQDLPLRILPSQATVTMFGCPFVNFAQYIFLDFETNTTIDNQYAVTGIKHEITPGKFTTNLTLSYGDAYGKYETIVDTLSRTVNEEHLKDKRKKSERNIQEFNKLDDSRDTNNMSLLKIGNIDKSIDRIIIHKIEGTNSAPALNKSFNDLFGISIKAEKIEFINIQEKFQVFYKLETNIKQEQGQNLIDSIEFKNLVIAIPNDFKDKVKTYYIDIFAKINKKLNDQTITQWLQSSKYIFTNDLFEKNNDIVNKNNDPKKLIDLIYNNYKDVLNNMLDVYIYPFLEIEIKAVESYNQLNLSNNNLEFNSVFFDNLNVEIKKKQLQHLSVIINEQLEEDNNSYRHAATKGRKKYDYKIRLLRSEIEEEELVLILELKTSEKKPKTFIRKISTKYFLEVAAQELRREFISIEK